MITVLNIIISGLTWAVSTLISMGLSLQHGVAGFLTSPTVSLS